MKHILLMALCSSLGFSVSAQNEKLLVGKRWSLTEVITPDGITSTWKATHPDSGETHNRDAFTLNADWSMTLENSSGKGSGKWHLEEGDRQIVLISENNETPMRMTISSLTESELLIVSYMRDSPIKMRFTSVAVSN